jgi:gamma-glutamyltranspeptidase / glutathione hydrolase
MRRAGRASHRAAALVLALLVAGTGAAPAATRPAARARHVMVSGPEPIAVAEGLRVLREGGNAADAAITMAFVLAVTFPQAGNLGGGGYMLLRPAAGDPVVIDYRETAPAAATPDMFLDERGEVIPRLSLDTHKAVGVPGAVAGLALAHGRAASIPWSRSIAPAVRLAREGFLVPRGLEDLLIEGRERLGRFDSTRAIFFRDGAPLREGDRLVQKDLAATLRAIQRGGAAAFYEGEIAGRLARDMARHGGLITRADLSAYRALERPPLEGSYRGLRVLTPPPSSSGGVALLQMLGMLEPHDLRASGHNSSASLHLLAETMKRAFADRARWLGDPAFFKVPVTGLLEPGYLASRMRGFDPARATPGTDIPFGEPGAGPGATTHFSVLDAQGNAASVTTTLNDWFGCGAVADGLGFLLNNEMDDFVTKPGAPNMYGLVGGDANRIEPGKRMLSSMTPTIVLKEGRPMLILGSPGGPSIITSVLQTLVNVVDFGMDLQAAVDAPRIHHQWNPDRLYVDEGAIPSDVIEALRRRGHDVVPRATKGVVQAILVDGTGWLRGASDARGYGVAQGN